MPTNFSTRRLFGLSTALARSLMRPPGAVVKRTTRHPWEVDGERLDPEMQHVLVVAKLVQRSMRDMGPIRARRYYAMICAILDEPPLDVFRTQDLALETRSGLRAARAYYPGPAEHAPCLVYIHGGGHTIGSIETHDALCRRLAVISECVVVSVDYRLAPEHPFPAAPEDCHDAYLSILARSQELQIDPTRVAVGGDSAGGNLAATVAAMVRDSGAPAPRLQLLIYPAVGGIDHEGRRNPGLQRHYGLDAETTRWFTENYVQTADYQDPGVAPLYLDAHDGLPPALIVTAHFDLLCLEGLEYVRALESAGVPVTHLHHRDLPHGFGTMSCVPRARQAIEEIGVSLRACFSTST